MTRPAAGWRAHAIHGGQRVLLLLASLLFCAAVFEVALRVEPELLGLRTANQLFSRYGTKPDGFYFREKSTDMFFMHPSFETRGYFNGYAWHHATDARGFRNPPGRRVDGTLLLGDSLIYGHGVEEEQSVAHALESEYGRSVYNLSRQGDSLYQHYVLLRLHLEAFRPETVLLFVFHNDFQDLLVYRDIEKLGSAPEIARDDYGALREALATREPDPHSFLRDLRYRSLTYRLFLALRSRFQRGGGDDAPADPDAAPPLDTPLLDENTRAVLQRYYARILGDLAGRCEALGTRLVVVYLDVYPAEAPATREAKARARALLTAATAPRGIELLDTGDLILSCESCMLPGDGHLTGEGHRRLARFLDEALGERS